MLSDDTDDEVIGAGNGLVLREDAALASSFASWTCISAGVEGAGLTVSVVRLPSPNRKGVLPDPENPALLDLGTVDRVVVVGAVYATVVVLVDFVGCGRAGVVDSGFVSDRSKRRRRGWSAGTSFSSSLCSVGSTASGSVDEGGVSKNHSGCGGSSGVDGGCDGGSKLIRVPPACFHLV